MRRNTLLICTAVVSLAANLLMVGFLITQRSSRATLPLSTETTQLLETVADSIQPSPTLPSAVEFRWSEIESTDFAQYAANLRRAGFPEQTVKDALLPLLLQEHADSTWEHARKAFAPRWSEVPEIERRNSAEAWDQARAHRRQILREVFWLEDYQVRGYSPWHLNVHQVSFGNLEDAKRQRLEQMRQERADLRDRIKNGAEPEQKLIGLISRQEAEISGAFPAEVLEQLRSISP
jgi:hypothetical protein